MKALIEQFPQQLIEGLNIGRSASINSHHKAIHHVLVSGLGGSGIGGTTVAQVAGSELCVPFLVNKGYELPSYAGENTLLIISSYSGNTEETVRVLEKAISTGAKIVCISSGGKVIETAKSHGLDHILIPGGMPPRACIGYSMIQQLFVLSALGLISDSFIGQLERSVEMLNSREEEIRRKAAELADFLYQRRPILYAVDHFEAALIRFRQQLNENSKMLCWHHVVPEMNHNELVGWRQENENLAVVWFRSKHDFDRCNQRIELNKSVVGNYTSNQLEVWSEGESLLEAYIYFINVGDWTSLYLAEKNGFDPMEIDVINGLKSKLSEMAW